VPAPAGETVFSSPRAAASAIDALAAGLVLLRSSEPSWVDVRDGQGQVLFSRTVQPGESVGLDGSLPIRLTIGNAAATQLAFRGQPINLAPNSRDNVARVELQ
jgi:cytoskeleton protein RodZ